MAGRPGSQRRLLRLPNHEIVRRYLAGVPLIDLHGQAGTSIGRIKEVLRAYDVPLRPHGEAVQLGHALSAQRQQARR